MNNLYSNSDNLKVSVEDGLSTAVLFWTREVGAHIIEYNSVIKKTFHDNWSTEDDSQINYLALLKTGIFNKGFAVRTGLLHRGPNKGCYLCCIDFDSAEAFRTWCDDDYKLDTLAKLTRVEWHQDLARVHVFFTSKTPLKDLARSKDNQVIEVYGEKPHLTCVYGNHKDGNSILPYDTEKITLVDEVRKLEIGNRIKMVIPTYLDDDGVSKYIEELEKPDTLVPKGSVHIACRTMLMSVYFRWNEEFAEMSDEQRFQWVVKWDKQKATQANRPAYIEANPKKLEALYTDIKRKYQGQRQKERDEREVRIIFDEMPGCIAYEVSHGKFIVGTYDNKIAEVIRNSDFDKATNQIKTSITQIKTFTACKPVKVIKHVNPLSFLETQDKYTIEFKGSEKSGCFTCRHRTLSEIVAHLKNGNALTEKGIEIALQAQIKGFERAGLLEEDDTMDFVGFFPYDGKIIASNVTIPTSYPDMTDNLDFINELESWYKGREDLLAHLLLWFMAAPLSFIFNVTNSQLLEWLHPYGNPNTGKTTSGIIGLAFDGNETNQDFVLNMKYIDSLARFGDTISKTTFPKIINEVDLTERYDIVNNIVTAVDAVKF